MTQKLPKGWEIRTLGEVTDIFKGGTPKRSVERYFQGDLAWATPTDITKLNGALYIDDTETHISEEALGKSAARLLPPGTVLLTSRATIGKVAISRIPIATNQGFANFLCKEEINNLFLAYYLKSRRNLLISLGTGTTFLEVTKATLLDVEIPLPPLPTQRKIAAVLSAYDDLIENNTRRIKILEDMAQTLYQEWFVHFRFPGHENVAMVESPLGPISQGWEVKRLADLVETQYGYTESASEDEVGPKFVRGKDINKTSYIDWSTVPFCPIESTEHAKYKLNVNDILVIRMADPGKVAIVEKEIDAVFASYLIRLKFKSKLLSPYYLFYALLDERYQGYIHGVSTGTTRKSASAGVITGYHLVIPSEEVRKRFEGVINSLRRSLNSLLEKNVNLRQTRDLLLPKLISGEIDVSELDIDNSPMTI